ncbi:Uma2 family endonuclease [Geminocystis sp. CENA526]|uniref:Uma2 family endonuclease n=1 Tax=Geminocystis sp. CENA526 TaxID=1355871 RepID=UPI003D6F8DAA
MQTLTKYISLEAFLQQPETKPTREYINGKIIEKPMPKGKHSLLQTELASEINYSLKKKRIGRAFNELRCTFGHKSLVPDISVFQTVNIPLDENGEIANNFNSPPDWTIEILSPEQSPIKVIKNISHCLDYGTQLGWLIDPFEKCILVYAPSQQVKIFENPETVITTPNFAQDFSLTVGDLFNWLIIN